MPSTLALRVAARYQAAYAKRSHEEIFVKVNALVDKGAADVVEALGRIPRLTSKNSCQGNDDFHEGSVRFYYGQVNGGATLAELHAAAEFYIWLYDALFARLEWGTWKLKIDGVIGTKQVSFSFTWDNRLTDKVVNALHGIAAQSFEPSVRP